MPTISQLLPLIPALPLAAALLTAVLGPKLLRGQSHWPVVAAIVLSCAASLMLLVQVHRGAEADRESKRGFEQVVTLFTWADAGSLNNPSPESKNLRVEITLRADPLTAVMLVVVTFVSSLVAIYSAGYMHGDPGYWRFFAYISLFVFSMTMLVSSSNFLLLYVFWEAVGLCSYLLIGFWYEKPAAAAAGMKAFLVNRIGDFGFALGIFLIWTTYGTLDFHDSASPGVLSPGSIVGGTTGTAICLLLLLGACGKSAQFPLHVWLPDAMEGPTPVSALIHAATMVTAGVYMLARCMPLFAASPFALHVVAIVGGTTALIGAFIAITQTDLKRILAYSTISHLGYMFLAMGTGTLVGVTAGMFHLVTHAFFKALLFLAAGSVMHAMGGVIDIRRFGGLRRVMPTTHWTFLVGGLSMAGFIYTSGFFSKDAILLAVAEKFTAGQTDIVYQTLYWTTFGGIFLIAVYTFRPFILTFYGPERIPPEAGEHAHESPPSMTVPLVILAAGAAALGFVLEWTGALGEFLAKTPSIAFLGEASHSAEIEKLHHSIGVQSTIMVFAGIAFTILLYSGSRRLLLEYLAKFMKLTALYQLSFGKMFFDPLYDYAVVRPLKIFAVLCSWFDKWIIDGSVNFVGALPRWFAVTLRPLQGGMIQFYALAMILGLTFLLGLLLL